MNKDEIKATLLCIIWEVLFLIASVANTAIMWIIFASVTVIDVFLVYFDYRIEQAEKRAKKYDKMINTMMSQHIKTILRKE
jgi:hypothetical protein